MKVGLFVGTESFSWQQADFTAAAQRAKRLGVDTLFIKIADGAELWYGGYSGIDTMLKAVMAEGIGVIPYIFSYANFFQAYTDEVAIVNTLLASGYEVCMDMESAWNGNLPFAADLVRDLKGKVWISTWADPAPNYQNWDGVLKLLAPVALGFLPQVYTAFLQGAWQAQYQQAGIAPTQIIPTFNIATLAAAKSFSAVTLWEYHELSDAQISQVVSFLGGASVPLTLSPSGCVVDLVKSFQLDNANNESQDMCGPWSVAELKYAGLPGHAPVGNAQNVDDWAEAEYTKYIGPNVIGNQNGSSIDNMHQFLKDAGLHWFDIAAISPGSAQSSDLANIHKALDAGYPVLVTVNELSVKRRDGSNPYPWQPRLGPVNHIFTIVGYTKDGYLLVDDELNQGDAWPDQYSAASIECHWASIVQVVGPDAAHPWLKPIPDPTTVWPAGFNAQNFAVAPPPPPPVVAPPPAPLDDMQVWNVCGKAVPFDITHAIPKSWMDGRHGHGYEFGSPLETERDVTRNSVLCKEQLYTNALASWNSKSGVTTWRDARGVCFQS